MLKKLSAIISAITVVFFVANPLLVLAADAKTPAQQSCEALKLQDSKVDCTQSSSVTESKPVSKLLNSVINILSIVVGAVSVIMIIIGGFRYIISGGDSAGVTAGKNTILYAVVGLVVVLFAQVIVRFVLTQTTK